MELTLAEEIRALLDTQAACPLWAHPAWASQLREGFPALAAKMLAVISERDNLRNRWVLTNRQAMEELTDTQNKNRVIKTQSARIAELEKERDSLLRTTNQAPLNIATARIAELKEDAVRWETRYRGAMDELTAAQQERDRLRWEAECLQVTVAK